MIELAAQHIAVSHEVCRRRLAKQRPDESSNGIVGAANLRFVSKNETDT